MKHLQDLKISTDSAGSLCTANLGNWQKVEKTFYKCQIKGWIIFLTELKLVPNVQNSRKLNQTSFLLYRYKPGSHDTRIDVDCLFLLHCLSDIDY